MDLNEIKKIAKEIRNPIPYMREETPLQKYKVHVNCHDTVRIPEEQKQTLEYAAALVDVFKRNECKSCKHKDKSLEWHRSKGLDFRVSVNQDSFERSSFCNLYESD